MQSSPYRPLPSARRPHSRRILLLLFLLLFLFSSLRFSSLQSSVFSGDIEVQHLEIEEILFIGTAHCLNTGDKRLAGWWEEQKVKGAEYYTAFTNFRRLTHASDWEIAHSRVRPHKANT